jgi:hypothetical protein
MTEIFASTAAVTIPLLAIAGMAELRLTRMPDWFEDKYVPINSVGYAVPVVLWTGLMAWMAWSEWLCLEVLRGRHASGTATGAVEYSMISALVFLVLLPAVSVLLHMQVETRGASNGHAKQRKAEVTDRQDGSNSP